MGCIGSKSASRGHKAPKPPTPKPSLHEPVEEPEKPQEPKYREIRDVGSGAFGVCKLMEDVKTGERVAVKLMERGPKIDINVEREVLNHKTLVHPNIVQFREVFLTETHLAVALEYADGGELFDAVARAGKLPEIEARWFFQQMILGLEYCHGRGVVHRDLKLENLLLCGSGSMQQLKIADFGYSKNMYASAPKSTVGTVAYIAPEVLTCKRDHTKYKGPAADLWSAGVILYVMLTGAYPFEDPRDPRNMKKTVEAILDGKYPVPRGISSEGRDLVRRLFAKRADDRISIAQIKRHPWFLQNLPEELSDEGVQAALDRMHPSWQSDDEIAQLLHDARIKPEAASAQEAAFFAKHGLMPDGHTAIAGWDSGEPVSAKTDPTLQSFDSDFIDGAFDDALTGKPERQLTIADDDDYHKSLGANRRRTPGKW